jgi:HSP20 family molecular chaperone IbpA
LYDDQVTDLFTQGAADLAEEARRLLGEIDRAHPGMAAANADCRPALDVIETPMSVDVVMDVPGVRAELLRVVIARNTLLVVGSKPGTRMENGGRFHIAERAHGPFARVVRLTGAFDGARAKAVIERGQLRVTLPLLEERRGGVLHIPVKSA